MKILFVVTAFYPEQAIGSIRVTKFVKFFQRKGDEISVLSLTPAPWAVHDNTLYFSGLEEVRLANINQSLLFRKIFMRARVAAVGNKSALSGGGGTSIKGKVFSRLKYIFQFFYTLLKAADWMIQVRRHVRRNLAHEEFDMIFTSYPSFASTFAGLMLKRMGVSRFLVTDFRDPISNAKTATKYGLKKWLQDFFVDRSDFLIFASNGLKDTVAGGSKVEKSDSRVVTNGFDVEDVLNIPDSKNECPAHVLQFVYTGSLYADKQNIEPFFSALKSALKAMKLDSSAVILNYAGHQGAYFSELADLHGMGGSVVDHGRVSRTESLQLQKISDVCLMATWNTGTQRGILTGKVFEYFMLQKPVIALISGDELHSEIRDVMDEVNAGFCFEEAAPQSFVSMIHFLKRCLKEKRDEGLVRHHYNEAVSQFDFHKTATELNSALKYALAAKDAEV